MFALDHLAFPCFDLRSTLRFYADVLGATLRDAHSGSAAAWNANEYLLVAFELPGGVLFDFFAFDGIERPRAGTLPKDIHHAALRVATRDEVLRFKARFEETGTPFWVETHAVDDVHVYVTDPNGVVLEILAEEDGWQRSPARPEAAEGVIARWISTRG